MLVFDKNIFGSKREVDENGYLRVEVCNITKTQVAPYLGREIPNYKDFGLDDNTIYNVLRPEEELVKAIPTFNNLPLTRKHIEVDVDNVPKDEIVGSLGDRAEYDRPYLKNSLIVYDKKEIDKIMSGKKKELSCGYRYTPVRENGVYDGKPYDFKMTNIIGNHIALVKEGRAGHDVVVSDTIEYVKDKIMGLFSKKPVVNDEFKESEHPRAENGQFVSAGGNEDVLLNEHRELAKKLKNVVAGFLKEDKFDGLEKRFDDEIESLWKKIETSGKLSDEEYQDALSDYQNANEHLLDVNTKHLDMAQDKAIPDKQENPKKAGEEKALKDGEKEMADKEVKEASEEKVEKKEPAEKEVVEDKCDEKVAEVKEEVVEEKPAEKDEKSEKKEKKDEKSEEKEEKVEDKCAMDGAMAMDIDAIKAQVRQEVMEDFKARDVARKAVRSVVGDVDVMAFDSSDEIYKFACEKAGMNLNEIASFKDAYTGFMHGKGSRLALDASPKSGSNEECFTGIRLD